MEPEQAREQSERDQLWASLRALRGEIDRLAASGLDGSEQQHKLIILIARGDDAGEQNDQLLLLLRAVEPVGREPVDLSAQGAQAGPQLIPLRLLLRLLRFHGGSFNEAPLIVATVPAGRKD